MSDNERLTALEKAVEERREFWHGVNNQLQQVVGVVQATRDLHVQHGEKIDTLAGDMVDLKLAVQTLTRGFPDGDPDGHRRAHEEMMEWRDARRELMRAAAKKAMETGVFVGLGWVCVALWQYFKLQIKS